MPAAHVGRTSLAVRVAAALALSLGLAACTATDDAPGSPSEGVRSLNRAGLDATDAPTGTPPALPRLEERGEPTPGLVVVDGSTDTLTPTAVAAFAERDDEVAVTHDTSGEARAFERLCDGDVDVADSARPITVDEYEQCRRHGLDVVRFRVAADGVVLAVGRQGDVGTDCLTTTEVRSAFGAGSTVARWSQLAPGLVDAPLAVAGPGVTDGTTSAFVRSALGEPEPTATDLRTDYTVTATEDEALELVAGPSDEQAAAVPLASLQREHALLRAALTSAWAAWAVADDEVDDAVLEQRRGVRDARPPAARAQDDARVRRAEAQRARALDRVATAREAFRPVDDLYLDLVARQRRVDEARGRVALFSYGFYAAHTDRLHALEIDGDGDGARDCVLPDPESVLDDDYPLARPLELTVTTRALQRPEVRAFLLDYLDHSQEHARQAGLLALSDAVVARQRSWVEGGRPPRFGVVDGRVDELATDDPADPAASSPPVQVPAR